MTRQKKELLRKIDDVNVMIQIEEFLSCGYAPDGAYDSYYEIIYGLEEELAHLRHYETVEAMKFDMRGAKEELV